MTTAAWQRLRRAAEGLPPCTGGIIECRYGDPDRADFGVRYLDAELTDDAPAALRPLAALWRDRPPAGQRVAWLEYDVHADRDPVESIFAGPGASPLGERPDAAEWQATLAVLSPAAPPEPMRRLLAALPAGAWIGYLGWMRGSRLRATVSGLTEATLSALLQDVGWPGDVGLLADVLALARRVAARLTLGLDLAGAIDAPLGIELSVAEAWDKCVPPMPAALLGWPGMSITEGGVRIVRRLNHLKFGFDGAAPPTLKAYLYYGLL